MKFRLERGINNNKNSFKQWKHILIVISILIIIQTETNYEHEI